MDIEVDMDEVDMLVVRRVVVHICNAMYEADDLDPSVDEVIVALGEIFKIVVDAEQHEPMVH